MKSFFYCLPLKLKKWQPINFKTVDFSVLFVVNVFRKQENTEIVKDFIKLHRD